MLLIHKPLANFVEAPLPAKAVRFSRSQPKMAPRKGQIVQGEVNPCAQAPKKGRPAFSPYLKKGVSVGRGLMTVKIRLKRTGMKKAPSYRIVVADSRSPRDGRIIENIGWYNPRVEPSAVNINEEKALNWLRNGAQPTESVRILLKRMGILDRFLEAKAASKQAVKVE